MKVLTCIVVFTVLILSCGEAANQRKVSSRQLTILNDSLTARIQGAYKMGLLKGFSVAVVNDEGVLYHKGFGLKHLDSSQIYTSSTVQPIGSISKTLIGVSLMKAIELELLGMDDPINKYLPFEVSNPNYPDEEILIKHLAYHTSSIVDNKDVYLSAYFLNDNEISSNEGAYDFFRPSEERISLEEYLTGALDTNGVAYAESQFSVNRPGEVRDYSNIGSDLCALIIQIASGEDFKEFTQQHILTPLEMNSSGWVIEDIDTSQQSRLFAYEEMMIASYSESSYSSGQFMTSSIDLGKFLVELIRGYNGRGKLLSKKGYDRLFSKQVFEGKEFGCFIEYTDEWLEMEDRMIGHNGADYGVFAGMYFNPKRGTGKIMISNTDTDFYDNLDVWPETRTVWRSLIDYEKKFLEVKLDE